jgi:hypothetical protein
MAIGIQQIAQPRLIPNNQIDEINEIDQTDRF